jgi:murein L,D-transpeptidase YafK
MRLPCIHHSMTSALLAGMVLWLSSLWTAGATALGSTDRVRLLVDTEALTLDVLRGESRVLRLDRISIGRGGAAPDRRRGDQRTPLGHYRITRVDAKSRFHLFFGLDYPTREQVDRAFKNGVINAKEYGRLVNAFRYGEALQDSPLGGQIGIHGLGTGSLRLHQLSNWTEGCIALTNAQIDQLRRYISIGTPVVIR